MSQTITVLALVAVLGGVQAQIGVPCHKDLLQFTPRHNLNISEVSKFKKLIIFQGTSTLNHNCIIFK